MGSERLVFLLSVGVQRAAEWTLSAGKQMTAEDEIGCRWRSGLLWDKENDLFIFVTGLKFSVILLHSIKSPVCTRTVPFLFYETKQAKRFIKPDQMFTFVEAGSFLSGILLGWQQEGKRHVRPFSPQWTPGELQFASSPPWASSFLLVSVFVLLLICRTA